MLSDADDEVVFSCEDVEIAKDSAGQRFIACAHPVHGYAQKYAELARRVAEIRRMVNRGEEPCRLCGGTGWLPLSSAPAHRQYALMRAIGFFRGVPIPQVAREREQQMQRSHGDTVIHSVPAVR
jgi:hypothetical protein